MLKGPRNGTEPGLGFRVGLLKPGRLECNPESKGRNFTYFRSWDGRDDYDKHAHGARRI